MELHHLECRSFEVAGRSVLLRQDPTASGALRPLLEGGGGRSGVAVPPSQQLEGSSGGAAVPLQQVGLVAWQCGFMLADYLLRRPPFKQWHDVRVLDLGAGTGLVGILLALAGADVVLADLPHITPLTTLNMQANCDPSRHRAQVVDYAWASQPLPPQLTTPPPDIIAGGDLVYDPPSYCDLVAALAKLAVPHTLVFLTIKLRGKGEASFQQALRSAGFAVQEVPRWQLGEEYRGGEEGEGEEGAAPYCLLRACKLG